MKANELRFGNYYDNNGRLKIVTPNTILELAISDRSWIKPIPLTEEWLLKFGFERHSSNPFWFKKLQVCVSLVGVIELISWDMQVFKVDNEIQYVHQLQNLYYALTGEELVYKNASN